VLVKTAKCAHVDIQAEDVEVSMPNNMEFQCPYCHCKYQNIVGISHTEKFKSGDAMLCADCGKIGALKDDWTIGKATNEDTCRWSCDNPIGFEKFEMMAADFRRDAARRQEG
jgi:hypothetical protein